MKRAMFSLVLFLLVNLVQAQKPATSEQVRQMLDASGATKLVKQTLAMMTASYKESMPAVPEEFWDGFIKEADVNELVEMLVPVYAKHYTNEEVLQLTAFYKSALGKKVVEKTPLITQESYNLGAEWGRKLGEKVAEKLKEKGYSGSN
jgi:hypothetical protein